MTETVFIGLIKEGGLLVLLLLLVWLFLRQVMPWLKIYLENQSKMLSEIKDAVLIMKVHQTSVDDRLKNIEEGLEENNRDVGEIRQKLEMKPRTPGRRAADKAKATP